MLNIPESIKKLYQADKTTRIRKNFRVQFPNGEFPDLTNYDVMTESVSFTESLMSQQVFRFGLTEASEIKFETVGIGNMLGMTIKCGLEIETSTLTAEELTEIQSGTWDGELVLEDDSDLGFGYFRIPLGTFKVDSCARSGADMQHRQVHAVTPNISAYHLAGNQEFYWSQAEHDTPQTQVPLWWLIGANVPGYAEAVLVEETGGWTATTGTHSGGTSDPYTYYDRYRDANGASYAPTYPFYEVLIGVTRWSRQDRTRSGFVLAKIDVTVDSDKIAQIEAIKEQYGATNRWNGMVPVPGAVFNTIGTGYQTNEFPTELVGMVMGDSIIVPQNVTVIVRRYTSAGAYTQVEATSITGVQTVGALTDYVANANGLDDVLVTLNSTAEEVSGGTTYYSYINAFELDKVVRSYVELRAMFGNQKRDGTYDFVHLDPTSPIRLSRSEWASMWWDEYDIAEIGRVKYSFLDDASGEICTVYNTKAAGGASSIYDMTDNWILQNMAGGSKSVCDAILDTFFVPYMATAVFTPVSMDMQGLPYLEDGDYLEIEVPGGEVVRTYILERTLSGLQHLSDSIESKTGQVVEMEV